VKHRLVIFLAVGAVLSFDRRCRGELASGLYDVERPWAREGAASPGECGAAALGARTLERLDGQPLLVLDAGAFLTRSRWCSWASPCQPALEPALAAFEAHSCEERPA
jgi:hypothetical protein